MQAETLVRGRGFAGFSYADLAAAPAVVKRRARRTAATVIAEDTALPPAASQLLAVSLVGMAQVSARFWLTENEGAMAGLGRDEATALVAGLAWRGIRGYPKTDES